MADVFDPYQAWLGISPPEQPPHFYRLLGVALFEADPAVIKRAGEQRLEVLRSRYGGQQAEAARRLTAEVSEALACLLNAEQKAVYDQRLRHALGQEVVARPHGETRELEVTRAFVETQRTAMPPPASSSTMGRVLREALASGTSLGQLGEYQLLEKLGQGGMGTVYKALHTKLGRVVALKVLSKDRVWDERAVARFEREMKAVGSVDHPNIVRAMDAREIGETRILVMEYVDGLDLAEVIRRCHPIPLADVCELVRQAALALEGAHQHGLVHRDVKPSNLMLTRHGQVKLLDLGLARFEMDQSGADEVTSAGQAIGTVEYMAPEQFSDSTSVDIRADIYSLGCTLYKFLAGRTPFGGDEYKGTLERLMAHVHKPVPPVWQYRGDVPPELAHVVERMLAKEPARRFALPSEVAGALAPWASGSDLSGLLAQAEGKPAPARSPAAASAPPVQANVPTEEASSTMTRFIRQVAEERKTPSSGVAYEEENRWARRVIFLASLTIVLLLGAIASLVAYRRLHPPEVPSLLVLDWPAEERSGVSLTIDGQPVELPPSGPLEHACPPGRHKLRATRPEFKPWETVVALGSGQRKEIAADWLPQTYLILYWRAEDRRNATLEINGKAVDLASLAGRDDPYELRIPVDSGPVWIRITRPGLVPFEERLAIVEGEDKTVRPDWDEPGEAKPAVEKGSPSASPKVAALPPAPKPAPVEAALPPGPKPSDPSPAPWDAVLRQYQARESQFSQALAPSVKLAAAWEFQKALSALEKVVADDPDHQERLAARRKELKVLAAFKERLVAQINRADPPLKKVDLMLRGVSGDVTKADERGIEATLATGKADLHPWSELSEKSRTKLLEKFVGRKSVDDWGAAGILAAGFQDTELAEKCFAQAQALGGEVAWARLSLAAESLRQAVERLDQGKHQETLDALDRLEADFGKLPWFVANRPVIDAARAKAKAGLREAEAEQVYAKAAQLLEAKELFDLRPLVEKLAGAYGQTRFVNDPQRKPSLGEMQQAVAVLGKVLSVGSDGKADFKSVQEAIHAAGPRSLIEIQDSGPYNEAIHIPPEKTGLVIRGKNGCWPVITSLGPVKDLPTLVTVEAPATLQRLILVHATPVGQSPHCLAISAGPVRVRAVLVAMEAGDQGLWTTSGSQTRFEDCLVLSGGTLAGSDAMTNCLLLSKLLHLNTPCEMRSVIATGILALGSPPSVLVDSIVQQIRNDPLHRIDHCNVFGAAAPGGSRDSFSADPLFRDPKNLDFQLGSKSPCLKKASDGGDLGCRFTAEMLDLVKQAVELRKQGTIKF